MKRFFLLLSILLISCDLEIPEQVYDDPLDLDYNASKGIYPPAFIFSPDRITVNSGINQSVAIHALEVDSIAGAHIQIAYDKNKVDINTVTQGDWIVNSNQQPIFFVEKDNQSGIIDIYYSILGDDEATAGSGVVAYLLFNTLSPGQHIIQITNKTSAVKRDQQQIILNGLGSLALDSQ